MKISIPHPGETIRQDYLVPLGMSVSAGRMSEIVRGERGVTADTALRLARYFNTTPEFWMGLQSFYDLRTARRKAGALIAKRVKPMSKIAA